jgi:hypothetical protein
LAGDIGDQHLFRDPLAGPNVVRVDRPVYPDVAALVAEQLRRWKNVPSSLRLLAVAWLFAATTGVSPAGAQQDCGTTCHACGLGYEGRGYQENGPYDMQCFDFVPYCVACRPPDDPGGLVADHSLSAKHIVNLVTSTPAGELGTVLERYRSRVLFSPKRNLLVVQGNRCDPEVLEAVLFVTEEKAKELQRLNLRRLEDIAPATSRTTN